MLDIAQIQQHIIDASQETIDDKGKIQASVIFCSYVNDNTKLAKEIIGKFFLAKKATRMIICEEHTKNGKVHHHALVIKDERFTIRNMNQFDINGEHPNIRYALKSAIPYLVDYVMKEDRSPFLYRMDPRDWSKKSSNGKGFSKLMVDEIIEESTTAEEAMETLTESGLTIRDTMCVEKYIDKYFPGKNPYYFPSFKYKTDCFTYPAELMVHLKRWIDCDVKKDRYPLFVIVGRTRRQKTSAFRALGPHLYFKKKVDLCAFANVPSDVKFIVMDDINPDSRKELFENNALMLGMEDGWTQRFLYTGEERVENTVPVIYLCNELPKQLEPKDMSTGQGVGYYCKNSIVYEINEYMRNLPHRYIEQRLMEKYIGDVNDKEPARFDIRPSMDEIRKIALTIEDTISKEEMEIVIQEMAESYLGENCELKKNRMISSAVISAGVREVKKDNKKKK